MICFVTLVPFKKQTLLKWRSTPVERDTGVPVNQSSVASVALNETELHEDEKLINSMDSSKPNEIHEELSNDSKTETLSDFTIADQEIDSTSQEDAAAEDAAAEDAETTCEPVPKLTCDVESDATSAEKPSLDNIDTSLSTAQTDIVTATANSSPPGSPEPLVVDDSATCAHKVSGEKTHTDQASDVKSNSGTETPQQGKRKKVGCVVYFCYLQLCFG